LRSENGEPVCCDFVQWVIMLNAEHCYQALKERDSRFDGRFFTAVKTTGIYCRPICPARTPLARNVVFYRHAATAEANGFRPCLRCRPDSLPGSPAWSGTSAVVCRSLRLIEKGFLDQNGVDGLAGHVGLGSRQLRRLFVREIGTSPQRVAQTRRAHFARKLLEETQLSITEIAFASGYASLRRFNSAIKEHYNLAPQQLRSRSPSTNPALSPWLMLKLPYQPPFSWSTLLAFFKTRLITGVETIRKDSYLRLIANSNKPTLIEVFPTAHEASLTLRITNPPTAHLLPLVSRVRALFDLEADSLAITQKLEQDPIFTPWVQRFSGLRVPGTWCPWEMSVRALLGQQISVKAATTICQRIVLRYGELIPDSPDSELNRCFPTPAVLRTADLADMGLTSRRQQYLQKLAEYFCEHPLRDYQQWPTEQQLEQLYSLPGIGPWTQAYLAMRAWRDPDAFPAKDLGIVKAIHQTEPDLHGKQLEQRAENWRPWRAYAACLLWQIAGQSDLS
jgi:AraC family transcriptional regulator, regulatory protein of adaptative response / DNA-3-methyladenine glycosylase II